MPPTTLPQFYAAFLPLLRANQLWFHAAHHLAKGVSFVGDHALYGDIYGAYDTNYDAAVEMAIPVCGEVCADAVTMIPQVAKLLAAYPKGLVPPQATVTAAVQLEQTLLALINEAVRGLPMPVEHEQSLGDVAVQHAGYVYKLGQRGRG